MAQLHSQFAAKVLVEAINDICSPEEAAKLLNQLDGILTDYYEGIEDAHHEAGERDGRIRNRMVIVCEMLEAIQKGQQ